jgi:hypothetical protein
VTRHQACSAQIPSYPIDTMKRGTLATSLPRFSRIRAINEVIRIRRTSEESGRTQSNY